MAEAFDGCLARIAMLTLHDPEELAKELEEMFPGEKMERDDLIQEALYAVQDLRCYWVQNAPKPVDPRGRQRAGAQRPVPLRQRQEVQEVPRRDVSPHAPAARCPPRGSADRLGATLAFPLLGGACGGPEGTAD